MDEFEGQIEAYSTATGQKRWVPAHWLTDPALSKRWSKTPRARADEKSNSQPVPSKPTNPPAAGDKPKE